MSRLLIIADAQIRVQAGDGVPSQWADNARGFQAKKILKSNDRRLGLITENAGDLHRGDFRVKLGNICQVFLKNLHIFSLGANTQHRSRIQHDAALHHRRTVEYAAIGFIQLVPGLLSHNPVRRQAKGALECHRPDRWRRHIRRW